MQTDDDELFDLEMCQLLKVKRKAFRTRFYLVNLGIS